MKKKIRLQIRFFFLFVVLFCCVCCAGKKSQGKEDSELFIQRFDVDFYRYLKSELEYQDLAKYRDFLAIYGENVLHIGSPEEFDFQENLRKYFSNPALQDMYRAEQETFPDVSALNSELSPGLSLFLAEFPKIPKPKVYLHVSGWEQKVIVADSILSLSADFYLGSDYPYYRNFFHDYQRSRMNPDQMAPDYLMGFIMANLPFEGTDGVLLDRMLYEGKLIYILSRLLPDRQIWECMAYSQEEYNWCISNEGQVWKTIVENQHLFTPNLRITSQYIKEAPHTAFLSDQSPGRVGVWVGYRIISAYMKRYPNLSLSDLMSESDYQEILKESKYKPF